MRPVLPMCSVGIFLYGPHERFSQTNEWRNIVKFENIDFQAIPNKTVFFTIFRHADPPPKTHIHFNLSKQMNV